MSHSLVAIRYSLLIVPKCKHHLSINGKIIDNRKTSDIIKLCQCLIEFGSRAYFLGVLNAFQYLIIEDSPCEISIEHVHSKNQATLPATA